jgi:hypothetical protein
MISTPRKLIYVCRDASMSLTSKFEGRDWGVTLVTPRQTQKQALWRAVR